MLQWFHRGSTSLVVQSDGSSYGQQRYYPYGAGRPTDIALPTDYRFTGQRREGTIGLYDYGARFYDPALGRFLSADTVVPQPGNPQALNRYAYVLNNPLRYVDPTGHYKQEYGYNHVEECWYRARGYQFVGTRSGWKWFGKYDLNLSDPKDAVYAVGTGENRASDALIMVNGTGAEQGYRGQSNNFNNWALAFANKRPGPAAFNLNYSRSGCDGLLGDMRLSIAGGVSLLNKMTEQIQVNCPGANIFAAGHSKGAIIVEQAMRSPGGERITTARLSGMAWFVDRVGDVHWSPHQNLSGTYGPLDMVSNQLAVIFTGPGMLGTLPGPISQAFGHDAPLGVDGAKEAARWFDWAGPK